MQENLHYMHRRAFEDSPVNIPVNGRLGALFDDYLCWAFAGTRTEPYCKELRQLHQYVPKSDGEELMNGVREIQLVHNILRSMSDRPPEQLEEKIKEILETMDNSTASSISEKL